MGFDMGDFDYGSGSGFGPYEAEVINAGVGIGKYGPEIVFVCKPTNPKRNIQTFHMGIGKEGAFEFGGNQQVITTGKGENAFDVTVYDEIVSGPKIKVVTKGGLFLNALKHLGVDLSGDMTAYIGLKLDLEEIKSTEAIRRFNEVHPDNTLEAFGKDYDITIPTKIISKPAKKVSLKEAVLEVIEGKTEADIEAWYKGTDRYDGSVTPLYKLLAELEKTEVLVVNDKYLVKKGSNEEVKE